MPNLLDLLPEDERKRAIDNGRKRLERNKARKGRDVPPEIFLVSKAGKHFGWEAVKDIRRGFTVDPVLDERGNLVLDKNGSITYKANVLTLDEVQLLIDGADKVHYAHLVEQSHAGLVSNSFKLNAPSFETAIKPFAEKAEVTE